MFPDCKKKEVRGELPLLRTSEGSHFSSALIEVRIKHLNGAKLIPCVEFRLIQILTGIKKDYQFYTRVKFCNFNEKSS